MLRLEEPHAKLALALDQLFEAEDSGMIDAESGLDEVRLRKRILTKLKRQR